ncbi:hypothetical protein DM01DRAFT_1403664 [Hesseltinella vesiculosa]|uniref:Rho-GAP domain-containing protein n=1 Tax=Hesseltinella vesiculosa TaxID=101127 RepID=A0A1X2GV72_9FUNG|nr:hypothetical protein DM01DRAFT_1403664 [Hesseltinella vesiculosa]
MPKPNTLHIFQDAFWTPASPQGLPNFADGLHVLHNRLAQSIQENNTIIKYIQRRIQAEEQYASYLPTDAVHLPLFDDDLGVSLKQCFHMVCNESLSSAQVHRTRATNVTAMVLDPVERMASKYKSTVEAAKKSAAVLLAKFDSQAKITLAAQQEYHVKCKKVQAHQPHYRPPPTSASTVDLASHTWSRQDLTLLLTRLDQTHQPLLGQHLLDGIGQSAGQDAEAVCQQLLAQGWITPTTAHFTDSFTVEATYAVLTSSQSPLLLLADPLASDEFVSSSSSSMISTASSSASSPSTFGFWMRRSKQPTSLQDLCQDMNQADHDYKQATKLLESLRLGIEETLFAHFEEMELLELERIQTLKHAFISMAAVLSNTIPMYQETYDQLMLYQETLHPEKDLKIIVEHTKVGRFCPKPILYTNFFDGPATDQIFGVPLEDLARKEQMPIPLLISNGLATIESHLDTMQDHDRSKLWVHPHPLRTIHKVRNELNGFTQIPITMHTLNNYDVSILSSVLWLYLLELPEPLTTSELYDTVKLLYAGSTHHDVVNTHLSSVGNLMATLPAANYELIKALLYHFQKFLASINDDKLRARTQQSLIHRFAPVFARSDASSNQHRHDRHPVRFLKDLLNHADAIFTDQVDAAHAQHQQRQQVLFQRLSQSQRRSSSSEMTSSSSSEQDRPPLPPKRNNTVSLPTARRLPLVLAPSSRTLFEDPEEMPPLVTAPSKPLPPSPQQPSPVMVEAPATMIVEDDDDDHISLDSFFLGE